MKKLPNGVAYESIIICGLDATGKATLTGQMAEDLMKQGRHVICITYPAYSLPWGQVVNNALHDPNMTLSMEQRFKLYALNRLETVEALAQTITQVCNDTQEIPVVIFDRFVTSNIMTLAYGHKDSQRTDLDILVPTYYDAMYRLETVFLERLGMQRESIIVPMLSGEAAIAALKSDTSRASVDLYENLPVQELARHFYGILARCYPKEVQIISQFDANERRFTPQEMSALCIDASNLEYKPKEVIGEGTITRIDESTIRPNRELLIDFLKQQNDRELSSLDPYIKNDASIETKKE